MISFLLLIFTFSKKTHNKIMTKNTLNKMEIETL